MPAPPLSRLHLRVLVFISGLSIMAVEMTGLRLLAPFFGTSLVVTTLLIGSLMGFLSLGYTLGGRFGDRYPRFDILCRVTTLAAATVLVVPFVAQPILRAASGTMRLVIAGEATELGTAIAAIVGGLLGTLFLFAAPVVLMGMVSPWAVRLAVRDLEHTGHAAGRLYALSTVGSILGSFLPALVLIPLLGVRNTFILVGFVLLLVSVPGVLGRARGAVAASIALPLLALPQGRIRPGEGVVFESESIYHFIQVGRSPFGRCDDAYHLYLNEGVAVHSVKCLEENVETRGCWAYIATGPLWLEDPSALEDVLIIGLAGGTVARHILESHPQAHIDGVEIDGAVVETGKRFFDNDDPRITPYVMDGRVFLQATDRKYDVIVMDAYRQPYIPFHLTTVEFWEQVRDHLAEGGVLSVNVASVRGVSDRLLRMMYRSLREVFPTVHYIDALASNDILIATAEPTPLERGLRNLGRMPDTQHIRRIRPRFSKKLHDEVEGWEEALVLTDDRAPVEMAWDVMTFEYIR